MAEGAPLPPTPTKKALLIGINYDERKTQTPYSALCVPHRDVIELKQLLIGELFLGNFNVP